MNIYEFYITVFPLIVLSVVYWNWSLPSFKKQKTEYFKFIGVSWKGLSFLISACSLIIASKFAGDPTWGLWISLGMSLFTYLSAPWTVGVLYRSVKREFMFKRFLLAILLWIASTSWIYDFFVFSETKMMPEASYENLMISSVWYFLAGLLWNLCWSKEKGLDFAFRSDDWYAQTKTPPILKILPIAALIIGLFGYTLWRLINA